MTPTLRALRIIAENPPLTVETFVPLMWPDAPGKSRYGCASSFLTGLRARGLIDWGIAGRPRLTDAGRAMLDKHKAETDKERSLFDES
jgi:hypothetical protein